MPRKPRTVLEHCVAVFGVHRGAFAAAHISQLAMTTHELGRVPTNDEYAEWWAVSERAGWNHRAEAREVFGDAWEDVVRQVADAIAARHVKASPGRLRSVPVVVA